jgi:endonuclease/exonuclease/phosphatase family metal-dependent hydrolase
MQVMGRPVTGRRWVVSALAIAALVLGLAPTTLPASAASFTGGTRTVSVTSSSVTVAPSTSWGSGSFRILASTKRADMKLSRLKKAKASARTTQSVVTLSGLTYTTAPYYYRVQAKRGSKVSYSKVRTVYLRPPTPSLRVVTSETTGLALVWSGPAASRYVVISAEDPTMVEGRRAVSLDRRLREYTPLDLVPGQQYWFQVQAYNGPTASLPSAVATATATAAGVTVRTMSYNLLRANKDGQVESGNKVAPWSQRKLAAAALIRRTNPDILTVQEASDWAGAVKGPRMVDDLRSTLGTSTWSLARTEIPPSEAFYFRTGRYILYKTAVFSAVGEGGHWNLGNSRFAAYQILQHRSTGAKVLVLSIHLEYGTFSRAKDVLRQQQTKVLLDKVRSYLANRPMPVLYLGDFNSHEGRTNVFDGPGTVMRPAHMTDSDEVAPVTVNRTLNSANKYARLAPRASAHVDHIYVPPGVGVRRFEVVAALSSGRFVGVIPSDHNPVSADLVLPYPAS